MLTCTCAVCHVVHVHRERSRSRKWVYLLITLLYRHYAHPVPVVVQVVLVDDGGDGAFLHGRGARPSIRRRRFRHPGRPGRRTMSTNAVAGATVTTTPGPHRGDRRDRQLRQDGGRRRFFAIKPFIMRVYRVFQTSTRPALVTSPWTWDKRDVPHFSPLFQI